MSVWNICETKKQNMTTVWENIGLRCLFKIIYVSWRRYDLFWEFDGF